MFYVSEIQKTIPTKFDTLLQKMVYQTLNELQITLNKLFTFTGHAPFIIEV